MVITIIYVILNLKISIVITILIKIISIITITTILIMKIAIIINTLVIIISTIVLFMIITNTQTIIMMTTSPTCIVTNHVCWQDFTVGILLHLRWVDERVYHVNAKQFFELNKIESLDFDSENIKKVWVPDIFFPNEKKGSFHKIMTDNQMMRLYKGGTILYISR